MKEYKGLIIPDLATKELMLKCIKGSHCMMPSDRCPGIDCAECLTSNQNKEYLREYLNEGGKDVSEFKVGDRVECTNRVDAKKFGNIYTVSGIGDDFSLSLKELGGDCCYGHNFFELVINEQTTQTTKESKMNNNISEVFDKTKDALLVEKHLGGQLGTTFIDGLILADKKTEVLAEAKRLEKEEEESK